MSPNSQNSIEPWYHYYEEAGEAIERAASDARRQCLGGPLPLPYQLKLQKLQGLLDKLADLDPRAAAPEQAPQKFGIGDKVYCRHLRCTGEIFGIAVYADQAPQARILSLHNGKLSQNWVSLRDLEEPLAKKQVTVLEAGSTREALSALPFLSGSSAA